MQMEAVMFLNIITRSEITRGILCLSVALKQVLQVIEGDHSSVGRV